MFILYNGFIRFVREVPLQNTPVGIWIRQPNGVNVFHTTLLLVGLLNKQKGKKQKRKRIGLN